MAEFIYHAQLTPEEFEFLSPQTFCPYVRVVVGHPDFLTMFPGQDGFGRSATNYGFKRMTMRAGPLPEAIYLRHDAMISKESLLGLRRVRP